MQIKNPEEHLVKVKIAMKINKILEGKKQKEVSSILGIPQPKVSDLMNGKLSGFSIPRLIEFLNLLHMDVKIVIKPSKSPKGSRGHLSVSF